MWVRPKTAKRTYRHAGSQLFLSSRVVTYFSSHFELDVAFSDVILITHSRAPLARTRHHRGTVGGTLWKFAAVSGGGWPARAARDRAAGRHGASARVRDSRAVV